MPFTSRKPLDKIHERKAHPTVLKHEPSKEATRVLDSSLGSYHLCVLSSYDPPQTWWALVEAQYLVEFGVSQCGCSYILAFMFIWNFLCLLSFPSHGQGGLFLSTRHDK